MTGTTSRFPAEQQALFHDLGVWTSRSLPDHVDRNAERNPDGLCVSDGRTSFTFAQARDRAWGLAGSLASLGIGRGDRVLVQLPNRAETVIVYYAIARLGAVFVPRMTIYREAELEDTAQRTGAKAIIVPDSFRKVDHAGAALEVARAVSSVREVIVLGDAPVGALAYRDLDLRCSYDGPRPDVSDLHLILFTSGSTGRAKGVMHSFNTYAACARGLIDIMALDESDRCFMPSPIMAQTGLNAGVVGPAIAGFGTVIQDVWDPSVAFRLIADHSCTHAYGAPTFINAMATLPEHERRDLPSLRVWGCGGAPIPPLTIDQAREVLTCRLLTMYGQSEACLQTSTRLEDSDERVRTSDGRAVPGMIVTIRDDDGVPVADGVQGEICCQGPSVMLGYWEDDSETAASFDQHGWFRSGDLGRMDDAGYLRVTGRKKDIIIRGGIKISAREIEDILAEHPQVCDVAVIGVPDPEMGERVCACVVPGRGPAPDLAQLVEFMMSRKIAMQKLPERLRLLTELPRTATGKVQKFALRQPTTLADGPGANAGVTP